MLAAVANQGSALSHAAEELKADKEVVLAAANQSFEALEFASEVLKGDQEVVQAAVKSNFGDAMNLHSTSRSFRPTRSSFSVLLATTPRPWAGPLSTSELTEKFSRLPSRRISLC